MMKTNKSKTDEINVKKEFEQVRKEIKCLDTKIDQVEKRLDTKIDQVEQRLEFKIDSKVDIATQSMKDYVDIKFDRMQNNFNQIQNNFNQTQTNFNQLGSKLDTAVKGIVDMIERSIGNQAKIEDSVQNHEQRILLLETKIG